MFGALIIRGNCVDGAEIIRSVVWLSDWTVGTEDGVFRLGVECLDEWSWARDYSREERSCRRH